MPNEIVPVVKATIVDPGRPKWVLNRVDVLAKIVKESYVEMTELLFEVKDQGHFRLLKDDDGEPFDHFEDYVEKHLGWKDRKAQYFVSIYEKVILAANVTKAVLAEIEWSKASQLAMLPAEERTPSKMGGWINKAKGMTFTDLKSEVAKKRNEVAGEKKYEEEISYHASFNLTAKQAANFQLAMATSSKISGSDWKGNNMDLICTEFLTNRLEESKVKMHRILASVERIFGVDIVAAKVKGSEVEILYGQKFAKKYGVE